MPKANPLHRQARSLLLCFSVLAASAALGGCSSTLLSFGADAAFTVIEERSLQDVVDDNAIKIVLNQRMLDDSLDSFMGIYTVVYQGRVLLVGTVLTAEAKARVGRIARTIEGVTEVINEIQVAEGGGFVGFVDDLAIERAIQTEYILNGRINSSNYRVRSVNGTVYLIGTARDQAELDDAIATARREDNVNLVINHMRLRKRRR